MGIGRSAPPALRRLALCCLALAGLAVVLPGVARPVYAQEPDFEQRVDARTLAVVRPILQQAERDALPVDALRAKVLEGIAKRVPSERIGQVVADLATDFRGVRSGLAERMPAVTLTDPEIVAAAMATRQGVPLDALARVWRSREGAASLAVPITVLGELVRRGVPVPDAAGVMGHVVRSHVPMGVAAQIPGKFDAAQGQGGPPGAALGRALRQLHIPDPPGRGRGPGG